MAYNKTSHAIPDHIKHRADILSRSAQSLGRIILSCLRTSEDSNNEVDVVGFKCKLWLTTRLRIHAPICASSRRKSYGESRFGLKARKAIEAAQAAPIISWYP